MSTSSYFSRSRPLVTAFLCLALASPSALAQGTAGKTPAAEKKQDKNKKAKDKDKDKDKPEVPALADSLSGEAKDAYESAKLLYNDGDYQNARLKFARAYELSQDPRLLWNMAAAEKQQRRYDKVLGLVERYLNEGGDKLSVEDRADARALIETVRTLVAEISVEVNEAGAEISVDGEKIGQSPLEKPALVSQGERTFRVTKPGFQSASVSKNVVGGTPDKLVVKLVPELHEGKLRVVAGLGDAIRVDGKPVGKGRWEGTLSTGPHTLRVSGRGKQPYESEVVVNDDQLQTERVALEPVVLPRPAAPAKEEESHQAWPWVAGGTALAVGVIIVGYLLFRPKADTTQPSSQHLSGTLPPGYTRLSF